MSTTFATGRSRTLTWSGDITDSFHGKVVPVAPPAVGTFVHNSDIDFRVIAYSKVTYLVRFTTYRDPNNLLGSGITQHVTATIDVGDGSPVSDDQYTSHAFTPLFPGKEVSWDMSGSWSVTCDVVEKCEVYSLGDADPDRIDTNEFPTEPIWDTGTNQITAYGGAFPDGLRGYGVRFFEVIESGTDIVATITCAGAGTATVTKTLASSMEVGYGFWNKSLNAWRNESSLLEIEHLLNGDSMDTDLSETLTASGAWGTGTITIEGDIDTQSGSGGGGYTLADSLVVPPISWKAKTSVRAWDTAYPTQLQLNLLKKSGLVTPILFTGTNTQSLWRQRYVEIDNEVHEANTNLTGSRTLNIFEQYPVRAWLDVDSLSNAGEYSGDWRLCFLGKQWDAGTIAHATTYVVDNGSSATNWSASGGTVASDGTRVRLTPSGTASLTRTFSGDLIAEGYRYLDIRWRSNGIATQTVTVTMAGKTWTAQTAAAGTYVTVRLDLACAGNETDDVEPVDSRFQIEDPGGNPTAKRPKEKYLLGWGVNYIESISFSGINTGWTSFDIDWIQFARDETKAYLSFLAPFAKYGPGWVSPTDTTTLQQYAFQYSDGRPTDWPAMAYVDVTSGTDYYRWFTITELLGMLEYSPGWSTVPAGSFPSDGFHNNGLEAYCLSAGGATFNFDPFVYDFTYWVSTEADDATITLKAQAMWDEVHAYPGAGRGVWDDSAYDATKPEVPLAMAKHLRARAEGMVFHLDQTPWPSVEVFAFETATPTNAAGNASTDAIGRYVTGTPWGHGNIDTTTELRPGDGANLSDHEVWRNRYRARTSFRKDADTISTVCDYDVSRSWRHARGYERSGDAWLGFKSNEAGTWTEVNTGVAATGVSICYPAGGSDDRLRVLIEDSGTLTLYYAKEDGTLTMAFTLGSGTYGDIAFTGNNVMYGIRLSGGTVYVKAFDGQGNALGSEKTSNLTGLDDAPIAAETSVGSGGESRLHVLYTIGGSLTVKTSLDGGSTFT
jgi:hypothetical protein